MLHISNTWVLYLGLSTFIPDSHSIFFLHSSMAHWRPVVFSRESAVAKPTLAFLCAYRLPWDIHLPVRRCKKAEACEIFLYFYIFSLYLGQYSLFRRLSVWNCRGYFLDTCWFLSVVFVSFVCVLLGARDSSMIQKRMHVVWWLRACQREKFGGRIHYTSVRSLQLVRVVNINLRKTPLLLLRMHIFPICFSQVFHVNSFHNSHSVPSCIASCCKLCLSQRRTLSKAECLEPSRRLVTRTQRWDVWLI